MARSSGVMSAMASLTCSTVPSARTTHAAMSARSPSSVARMPGTNTQSPTSKLGSPSIWKGSMPQFITLER